MSDPRRGTCPMCGREMNLKVDGRLRHHASPDRSRRGAWGSRCDGAGKFPEVVDLVAALKHSLEKPND